MDPAPEFVNLADTLGEAPSALTRERVETL